MKLTTDTYQNHLDNEYRQRTESFAHQQRLAQALPGLSQKSLTPPYRLMVSVLIAVLLIVLCVTSADAHDTALTVDETHLVLTDVSASMAFRGVTQANAVFQQEAVQNGWMHPKQRPAWGKSRALLLISYE